MSDEAWVASVLGAPVTGAPELVQELWSGYGRIERLDVDSSPKRTVILKAVDPPAAQGSHPRGWGTDRSHARKLRSYDVERTFYAEYSERLHHAARVPRFLGGAETASGSLMLLEDLDAAGFGGRRRSVTSADIHACLGWLAGFHATFLGTAPTGLWERGTYWHLATRPDELAATEDATLRAAAPAIDARLHTARFRTWVHGDAKLANFCFGEAAVAAVDFQYVGGGVGVQDVAYFLGSCLEDDELEAHAAGYLDAYFLALRTALPAPSDADAIESEWRGLWPIAWADFHRFLAGWSPGHWKLSRYSAARLDEALRSLATD